MRSHLGKLSTETEHKCVENYAPTCVRTLVWQATRRKDIEGIWRAETLLFALWLITLVTQQQLSTVSTI